MLTNVQWLPTTVPLKPIVLMVLDHSSVHVNLDLLATVKHVKVCRICLFIYHHNCNIHVRPWPWNPEFLQHVVVLHFSLCRKSRVSTICYSSTTLLYVWKCGIVLQTRDYFNSVLSSTLLYVWKCDKLGIMLPMDGVTRPLSFCT